MLVQLRVTRKRKGRKGVLVRSKEGSRGVVEREGKGIVVGERGVSLAVTLLFYCR
jgi:hypothetical protein